MFTNLVPSGTAFVPHRASPGAKRFTNAELVTHEGKKVRFYDDLIRGRQTVTNFMYAECHGACPIVTAKMVQIYNELKDRMGRDVFFYSISVKPEQDTPEKLKEYAEMHRANLPGWTFLTGDPHDIETIRFKLFRMNHPGIDLDFDSHVGALRIINDATNTWTKVQTFASLTTIMRHIAWADPMKDSMEDRLKANNELQRKINEEVKLYGYRKFI
jgi:protein SCO1/2